MCAATSEGRFIWGWIAPYFPHPNFVKGSTCYMCGEADCRESMPHGNHPDWLLFCAQNPGPDSPWGTEHRLKIEAAAARRSE